MGRWVVAVLTIGLTAGQCGQGPPGDDPVCSVEEDLKLVEGVVNASAVTMGDEVFIVGGVSGEGKYGGVWGLLTEGGQEWRAYDMLPKPIVGRQFAEGLHGVIFVFVAGSMEDDALPFSNLVFVFDPLKAKGNQWQTITTTMPLHTHARVQLVGEIFYLSSPTITLQWNPIHNIHTQLSDFTPRTTEYLFLTDSEFLYAVGGVVDGSWTQDFLTYEIATGVSKTEQSLYAPVKNPMGLAVGGYLYVVDWGQEDVVIGVWSNLTKNAFTSSSLSWQGGSLTGYAAAIQYDGSHKVYYYSLGGVSSTGAIMTTVTSIDTGFNLPAFTCRPEVPVAGGTAEVTLAGVDVEPSYAVRLGSTVGCSTRLVGTVDENYASKVTFQLSNESYGVVYMCFSIGVCPVGVAKPCSLSSTGSDVSLCPLGCCRMSNDACVALEQGGNYLPLSSVPITITSQPPVPPSPSPTNPPSTPSPPSGNNNTTNVIVFIVCGIIIVGLIIGCAGRQIWKKNAEGLQGGTGLYSPVHKLGSGAYGVVYLVRNTKTGEHFAMKYIACSSDSEREEAMKEFMVLKGLQGSSRVVRIVEIFMNWAEGGERATEETALQDEIRKRQCPRYVSIVMEYYKEGDLRKYISERGEQGLVIEEEIVLSFARQICELLVMIHGSAPPIVHRDLKPENILLKDNRREIVVSDFGLARQIQQTYCNTQAGSLPYVAPECWERHYGTEVDVWALGCIMYSLCSLRADAHNTRVMFSDVLKDPTGLPLSIRQELSDQGYSPPIAEILLSCLIPDYHDRPPAVKILEQLEEAME